MNWDAIGAIAETLGAVGVIASLVYLATQIRHSREQMRAATYQQLHESIAESANSMPGPEMELVRLGNADFHSLNEQDGFRYNQWAFRLVMSFEDAHYQYRIKMLDEDRWRVYNRALHAFFAMPGFCQWWDAQPPGGANMMSPEFNALVEEILGEESGRRDQ
jgi:hypothetical protein